MFEDFYKTVVSFLKWKGDKAIPATLEKTKERYQECKD